MHTRLPLLGLACAAVVFSGPRPSQAQQPEPTSRVRIEVTTTENGETTTTVRELDGNDGRSMEEVLRELGVWEDLDLRLDGENLSIDIRRWQDGRDEETLERALRMVPQRRKERAAGGWLGVSTATLDEAAMKRSMAAVKEGALVLEVIAGSPAEAIGLRKDDVITALGGRTISGPQDLVEAVRLKQPGDKVDLIWYRGQEKHSATVELGERKARYHAYQWEGDEGGFPFGTERFMPHVEPRAYLGVGPGEPQEGVTGAIVGSVDAGSAAETMGLRVGDVITTFDGETLSTFAELRQAVRTRKPGQEVSVTVLRDRATLTLTGSLGEHMSGMHMERIAPGNGPWMREFRSEGFSPEDHERLRRQLDELRAEMEQLRTEMGKGPTRELRMTIDARRLTEEEKTLLRGKGVEGLDEEARLDDLRAFPNPSNGMVRLSFTAPERGDLQVLLFDTSGDRVYEERITAFSGRYERTLDISDKAAGTYFLVITQNGRSVVRKMVKEQ